LAGVRFVKGYVHTRAANFYRADGTFGPGGVTHWRFDNSAGLAWSGGAEVLGFKPDRPGDRAKRRSPAFVAGYAGDGPTNLLPGYEMDVMGAARFLRSRGGGWHAPQEHDSCRIKTLQTLEGVRAIRITGTRTASRKWCHRCRPSPGGKLQLRSRPAKRGRVWLPLHQGGRCIVHRNRLYIQAGSMQSTPSTSSATFHREISA